jgi:DNA-binding MarR family transcriptional regulator
MAITPVTGTAAAETPEAIAGRLRLSATRLARRLRQEAQTGLSPSQLSALAMVERHGPVTLGDLAECEQVSPPTITRVVVKLEADGLLTRQPDPDDRRVTRVLLTPKGKTLLSASRRRKTSWLTMQLVGLDATERARLADALDALDALTAELR